MGDGISARTILIVSHACDQEVAGLAERISSEGGYLPVPPNLGQAAEVDLCIVIVSQEAARDAAYIDRANAAASRAAVTIPVRLDGVRPEQVGAPGSPIRERNWADFSSGRGLDADAWRRVLRANVGLYDLFYDIEGRAGRWGQCGRDHSYLMLDIERVTAASEALESLKDDPFQRPTRAMEEFVAASLDAARRARRGRRRREASFVAFLVIIALGIVAVNGVVRRYLENAQLLSESMRDVGADSDPAFYACRMLQMGQSDDVSSDASFTGAIDALSRPWEVSQLGLYEAERGTGWQGEAVFSCSGEKLFVEGAGGTLQSWDPLTADPMDNRRVTSGKRFAFDVSADGGTVVVSDSSGLRLYETASWVPCDVRYQGPRFDRLAISEESDYVLGASGDGLACIDLSDGKELSSISVDDVLAVKQTGQGARGLVRAGNEVLLVGGRSLDVLSRAQLPGDDVCVGALSADGEAILCQEGTLMALDLASDTLVNVGYSTREIPLDMALVGDCAIVATDAEGVCVVDVRSGALLGEIATETTGLCFVEVAENGLVSCGNGWTTTICSLDGLAPSDEPPSDAIINRSLSAASEGGIAIRASEEQSFVLTVGEDEQRLSYQGAYGEKNDLSVVAIMDAPVSYALASASGRVVAYTLGSNGHWLQTRAWDSPDGQPITALGWTRDGKRLVIEAGGRWWTPYSNSWAMGTEGMASTIAERSPAVWTTAELSVFPDDFVAAMGMRGPVPVPEAR